MVPLLLDVAPVSLWAVSAQVLMAVPQIEPSLVDATRKNQVDHDAVPNSIGFLNEASRFAFLKHGTNQKYKIWIPAKIWSKLVYPFHIHQDFLFTLLGLVQTPAAFEQCHERWGPHMAQSSLIDVTKILWIYRVSVDFTSKLVHNFE